MQSPKATWSAYFLRNLLIRTRQKAWKDFSKDAGWLGGGQGNVGDGIGKLDAVWDKYLGAYKVVDDDTAGFWGAKNLGRFVNDQSPSNLNPQYQQKLQKLASVLDARLERDFFRNK